jgi:predicted amidohydrolase
MVLIGYNTMTSYPSTPELDHLTSFHNHLPMQANAYCNATWVLASARVGTEEGVSQIGGSCIISPTGEIVAMASSAAPGLVVAEIDLDFCQVLKKDRFNMRAHRRPEAYGLITAPVEDTWPPLALD